MRQGREIERWLSAFRTRLAGWRAPHLMDDRVQKFTVLPLDTDKVYEFFPMWRVLIPPCKLTWVELNQHFGYLMQWIAAGRPVEGRDAILRGIRGRATPFIDYSPERFLLWAGRSRECRLVRSEGFMVVEGEDGFGIEDGVAFSSLGEVPYTIDTHIITQPTEHRTRDAGFRSLYRRALELGDQDSAEALCALKASTVSKMIDMAPWLRFGKGSADADRIGEVLSADPDPVGTLYRIMVPLHMDPARFEKKIARLDERPLNPDADFRQNLWDRMRHAGYL